MAVSRATASWLVLVLVLAGTVGCGSTVPAAQQQAGSVQGTLAQPSDGLSSAVLGAGLGSRSVGGPAGTPASGSTAVSGSPDTGPVSSGAGREDGQGRDQAPVVAAPGTYRPGVPGVSQGVSDTSISVGVVVLQNGDKFANGLGLSISFGDAEKEFKAVTDDINRRGGIAGRKLEPVVAYYDVGGAAVDGEGLQASICAQFTQDRKVFAVFMPYNPTESFIECLAKSKTLLLNGSAKSTDDVKMRDFAGWLYQPSLPSYSRYPGALVTELDAAGFFRGSVPPKAGVLVLDSPDMVRAAETVMKPAVEAAGVPVAAVTRINPSSANSDISGAVLKFRSEGITHVFFVQAAGGIPLYFMQGAEQQGYFPKYAVSSFEVPGFFLQDNAPERQLQNASGIGWAPFFDVKAGELPPTPAERRCFDVIAKGGERNAHRQSNLTATPVCDMVWAFARAAEKAGVALDFPRWRQGLRALGSAYASPVALRNDFTDGASDAVAGYRFVTWIRDCSCFRYTGPLKAGL